MQKREREVHPLLAKEVESAAAIVANGGVILYPTDTVWGIGCDATNAAAVAKVFEIKQRAESKSLILLAADMDMVCRYVRQIPEIAIDLVEVNDTPMTIIYPGAMGLAEGVVAEDGSVGIRIPDNDFCRMLIRRIRRPLVSTSANISGEATPKRFEEISSAVKESVDHIVDPRLDKSTHKASQIIKVGLKGEIEILRK